MFNFHFFFINLDVNTIIGNSSQRKFLAQYSSLVQTHLLHQPQQSLALCMNDTVHFVKIER